MPAASQGAQLGEKPPLLNATQAEQIGQYIQELGGGLETAAFGAGRLPGGGLGAAGVEDAGAGVVAGVVVAGVSAAIGPLAASTMAKVTKSGRRPPPAFDEIILASSSARELRSLPRAALACRPWEALLQNVDPDGRISP